MNLMQRQLNLKSLLYDILLDEEEIQEFVNLKDQLIVGFVKRSVKHLLKHFQKKKQVYIFMANYRKIVDYHFESKPSIISNNLSLHFASILSYYHISDQNYQGARIVLKQTQKFLDVKEVDPILLSVCFNNLAVMHFFFQKYYKGLIVCLQAAEFIHSYLIELKSYKKNQELRENVVIYISLILWGVKNLKKIMIKDQRKVFKKLYKKLNNYGYRCSLKYLGRESLLFLQFQQPFNQSFDLPVYEKDQSEEEEEDPKQFYIQLIKQLVNIETNLKEYISTPKVYYIREHIVEERQPEPQPQPEPVVVQVFETQMDFQRYKMEYEQKFYLNQWEGQMQLFRDEFENMGQFHHTLKMSFCKDLRIVKKIFTNELLFRFLSMMNIYDVLGYQFELKTLQAHQFLAAFLIHFMSISGEDQLEIYPRAKSLINPFCVKFCGEKTIIFFYHIRFSDFRIAICPYNTAQTIYLDVEFKDPNFGNIVEVEECFNKEVHNIEKNILLLDCQKGNPYKYKQRKNIKVKDKQHLQTIISHLIGKFQRFLFEIEEQCQSQLSSFLSSNQHTHYYKYVQYSEENSKFYFIKYRSNICCFQTVIKNNFKSYSLQNKKQQARGSSTYSPKSFYRDFGISTKSIKSITLSFCQIIQKKYNLSVFKEKFNSENEELYSQNAVIQAPIVSKCYKIFVMKHEDYFIPVTIELLTINKITPIGIKATAYEPIKSVNSSHFIHIVPQYWQKISEDKQQYYDPNNYEFKKGYFIVEWLQKQGFAAIFKLLRIKNRNLQIECSTGKYSRIDVILSKIY